MSVMEEFDEWDSTVLRVGADEKVCDVCCLVLHVRMFAGTGTVCRDCQ